MLELWHGPGLDVVVKGFSVNGFVDELHGDADLSENGSAETKSSQLAITSRKQKLACVKWEEQFRTSGHLADTTDAIE